MQLEYRLFDAEGELVEAPGPEEPMEFIFGMGQAPAAIEQAIDGLGLGQSRRVQLSPEEAFGSRDEAALISVEASELPAGAGPGDEFEAEREDGETVFLRVVELEDGVATLDSNHPLAGQRVALELTVRKLRAASSDELREAELGLAQADPANIPDVLASSLLRRARSNPSGSA